MKFIGENASEEVVYLVDEREILGVVRTIKDKVKDKDIEEERKISKEADKDLHSAVKK